MQGQLWESVHIKDESYVLINLDHPYVEARVRSDMDAGVAVFYDCRWGVTEVLNRWLLENLDHIRGKRVLVLGAGVGAETVVLGKYCSHVWINDLAPAAVELCAEQMDQNGLENYTTLLGSYEAIDLPEVDLVVASFLIYDAKTLKAMRTFLGNHQGDVLLVNERLKAFRQFLKIEKHTLVFDDEDGAVGIYLNRGLGISRMRS
ncbi:MAG: methyltransferase domain-containing protein [Opitutaceae bacterium]